MTRICEGEKRKTYSEICATLLDCLPFQEDKITTAINLRSLLSIKPSERQDLFGVFGDKILSLLSNNKGGLIEDEGVILTALINKAKGTDGWYEPERKYSITTAPH